MSSLKFAVTWQGISRRICVNIRPISIVIHVENIDLDSVTQDKASFVLLGFSDAICYHKSGACIQVQTTACRVSASRPLAKPMVT